MASSTDGDRSYDLEFSAAIAETIRELQRRASREGRGYQFLQALRKVVRRVRRQPMDLGEPLYRLPVLKMLVRCVAIGLVEFAVCEDRPVVYLKAVRLLSKR